MKSIAFFLSLFLTSAYSFAQTRNPPFIKSFKEVNMHPSLTDAIFSPVDPKEMKAFITSYEVDLIDSTLHWIWYPALVEWVLTERIFNFYDTDDTPTTVVVMHFNGDEWVNVSRNVLTFDEHNNLLNDLIQSWNGSAWQNMEQWIYTYNSNDIQTSQTSQLWDGAIWINNHQVLDTYDDQLNIVTRITAIWLGSEWSVEWKIIFTYNEDNRIILQEVQHWDGMAYVTYQQFLLHYNDNGDLDTSLNQIWAVDHWENYERDIYEYDDNHNVIFFLKQVAANADAWLDNFQSTSTYDAGNKIISVVYQTYAGGNWVNWYQLLVGYDSRGNPITAVFQSWDDKWVNQDSLHSYFSLRTAIPNTYTAPGFNIYPNPVRTILNIEEVDDKMTNSSFTVFSQNGVKMMEGTIEKSSINTIDVNTLMPGNYFLLHMEGNKGSVHHFIKVQE